AVALAVTGPAAPGLSAGVYRGRGDLASPFAVPLALADGPDGGRRIELQFWAAGPTGRPARASPDPAELGAGAARAAAALAAATPVSRSIADAMADRPDVANGLAALAARWTDSDGLVRVDDAALPGAV